MGKLSGEAVRVVDEHNVKSAGAHGLAEPVEGRAVKGRARVPVVHELSALWNREALLRGQFAKFGEL